MRLPLANVGSTLGDIWNDATGTQAAPADAAIVATAVLAIAIVLVPRAWSLARNVVTIAHEGAHGVAALLSGRQLTGIRVHSDTSGLAVSKGKPRGPGMIATAAAGYIGPALLGLLAAFLLSRGHALGVLWLAVLLLGLLTLKIRNFYGLWAVLVAGFAVFAVSWWGNPDVQSLVAYTGAWFLLFAAPRPVLEMQAQRRRGRAPKSDADVLAHLTHLPALLWVGFFLLVTIGVAVLGTSLLIDGLR
ncbi:MAG: M50 family metallopeptidase [Solirubrobacteraceae bacterium]|nr:M50 family metallopeptidase [Solirubrobacteraceae bacterium]